MTLGSSVVVGIALALTLSVFWGVSGPSASAQVATDPIFVGAGDIASCQSPRDEATAKLLDDISGTVFTTGDNAYNEGTLAQFSNCYGPTWGRHKARTKPTPGNHEYLTVGASGYFEYFGLAAGDPSNGYYSYSLGNWHMVALNSMCEKVGGCDANSPMVAWLKDDLAANPDTCTLAYFHHPLFSSGQHGNQTKMRSTWDALYDADADVVLSGHSHNYERFAPQTPDGVADPTQGIREFVVGTGGAAYHGFGSVQPNSEVRGSGINGVLKLSLHPGSYDWEFVPVADQTFTDSGSGTCSGGPPPGPVDTTPPLIQPPQQDFPTGATLGTSNIPTTLSWSATDDQSSITGYELQQSVNAGSFTRVGLPSATSTAKNLQLKPGSTYQFRVRATDSAGNTSGWADGPTFLVEAQQEAPSTALIYAGSWIQQTSMASAYGGALRYADTRDSSAQFTFSGHNVAWVSTKGPNMGKATVSVDGMVVKTVDLYSPTTLPRRITFSQSSLDSTGNHTLRVQATGTKRSASSGTRVDVDAFVTLR